MDDQFSIIFLQNYKTMIKKQIVVTTNKMIKSLFLAVVNSRSKSLVWIFVLAENVKQYHWRSQFLSESIIRIFAAIEKRYISRFRSLSILSEWHSQLQFSGLFGLERVKNLKRCESRNDTSEILQRIHPGSISISKSAKILAISNDFFQNYLVKTL